MIESEERLRNLLKKLFETDYADLDYGIHRIMNQKREEIDKFIDEDLLDAVDEAIEDYSSAERSNVEEELSELAEKVKSTLADDAILPNGDIKDEYKDVKIAEYYLNKKEELDNIVVSEEQKVDIFNHIYQFFSRYYSKGDFISQRFRSKDEKYSIPYKGEEVKLYWANHDQYYIKTTEYLNNYVFKLDNYRIRFKVVQADEEQNNNKGEDRYFFLVDEDPLNFDNEELTVYFQYREPDEEESDFLGRKHNKQELLNEKFEEDIIDELDHETLENLLQQEKDGKSVLFRHLNEYAKRNTSDYFIHKDLEGFLLGELDYYLKTEVLQFSDLENLPESDLRSTMARAKAMKSISEKIIAFLGQIEDFQKMLWEKKKFVVNSDYCMTLDYIPSEFYEEILDNDEQIEEWKELYKLEESIEGTLEQFTGDSEIDENFLKNHQSIMLDTRFFDENFKDKLLSKFEDLDDEIDGLLIKSENWQGMKLIEKRYSNSIKCTYIDPPYNTGSDDFPYKDNYQHSSWLTMIENRLELNKNIFNEKGIIFISINDYEVNRLRYLLNQKFGEENLIVQAPTITNLKGNNDQYGFAGTHEYVLVYSMNKGEDGIKGIHDEEKLEEYEKDEYGYYKKGANLKATGTNAPREKRPNLYFPIYVNLNNEEISLNNKDGFEEVLPITNGKEMSWRWSKEKIKKEKHNIIIKERNNDFSFYKKQRPNKGDVLHHFKPKSILYKPEYSTTNGTNTLKNLFDERIYSNPKSVDLIKDLIFMGSSKNSIVIDYFAGSGTTGQAIIEQNFKDGFNRKYIMIEMADYFDEILLKRLKKISYSKEWSDGIPISDKGHSQFFKYINIEQYEDTLNNIEFVLPDGTTQKTLDGMSDYFLRYMLDFESRESMCRLNVDKMVEPFDYSMRITVDGEVKENVNVDLVETFNYLLGLHVEKIKTFENEGSCYKAVYGHKDDDKVAVVWRDAVDLDLEKDKKYIENIVLDDFEFDKLYVNGECDITDVLSIERKFKNEMYEKED